MRAGGTRADANAVRVPSSGVLGEPRDALHGLKARLEEILPMAASDRPRRTAHGALVRGKSKMPSFQPRPRAALRASPARRNDEDLPDGGPWFTLGLPLGSGLRPDLRNDSAEPCWQPFLSGPRRTHRALRGQRARIDHDLPPRNQGLYR
jgi:hypothetical protein